MSRSVKGRARRRRRSKFEMKVETALAGVSTQLKYEAERLPYELQKNYIPDFSVRLHRTKGADVIFEAKGRFTSMDRSKMLAVKKAHPYRDIRLVFMRNNPLYKGSKTRYMDWAASNGFKATVYPELPL